jgi:hypothetical protein
MAEAHPPDSDDPADWATAFCQQAVAQNYPCIDWHLMRAWFDAAMRRERTMTDVDAALAKLKYL